MVVVTGPDQAEAARQMLQDAGETVVHLGTVTAGQGVRYQGRLL
jgi:phosphoribosylformylglycinamidine cyclo-ligase